MLKNKAFYYFTFLNVFFYFNFTNAQEKKTGFIATFPSSVLPNSLAKFCIRFENLKSSVSFTVEDDEPRCFDKIDGIASPSVSQYCVDVRINNIVDETKVKLIKVYGKSQNGDYQFNDTKKFTYKIKNYFTMVETDKPIYKPGDKVRIRLLTVDYALRPQTIVFKRIFVIDSSGSRVNQWLDLDSKRGLLDLDMQLSKEPNMGKWTIEVHDDKLKVVKAFFEVKKYVLPKFEVSINHKNKISSSENAINVSVCSKYSHGGNVKGSFELFAFTKRFYNDEIISAVNKTKDEGKGCVDFEIKLKEVGVEPKNYVSTVYFEASVVESTTDIKANSSSTAAVTFNNFEAEFIEPSYYKPGFPIHFKIFVKTGDDSAITNENIEINLMKNSEIFYKTNLKTDQNGYLEFTYEPTCSNECKKITLSESPETITIKLVQLNNNDPLKAMSKLHYIRPWSNEKNSYIQIYKPTSAKKTAFSCNEEIKSKIILRSAQNFNGNLYYQIQSRSSIIASGYFNSNSNRLEKDLLDSNYEEIDLAIRTIKNQRLKLDDTSKYNFVETNLKTSNNCQIKTENQFDEKLDKWYYDIETNRCEKLSRKMNVLLNVFDSKKKCDDECKYKEYYYDATGTPVVSKVSKVNTLNEKQFEFEIKLDERMSPEIKILFYCVINGEIIADSLSIETNKCLTNKVNLSLQETTLRVSKRAEIEIKSEPNSICALSVIDKSVTFMGMRNTIDLSKVFENLADFELIIDSENDYANSNDESECFGDQPPYPMPMPRPRPRIQIPELVSEFRAREKRSLAMPYFPRSTTFDSTKAFKDGRVIYLSDFKISKPCVKNYPIYFAMPRSGILTSSIGRKNSNPRIMDMSISKFDESAPTPMTAPTPTVTEISTERQYFPETWLWSIDVSDENGLIRKKEKTPDSITDWILDAYCVSNKSGLGISNTQVLKVFQPLFVSVNLPYSVIMGEVFPVKASVFNYETTCVPIKIEIILDRKLVLDKSVNKVAKLCVCPDEEITHKFNLKAIEFENENGIRLTVKVTSLDEDSICNSASQQVTKKIAFLDSETKNILVEPEGIPKEHLESNLIILEKNSSTGNLSFELSLPSNVVPRSSRVYLSVIGDSMGSVLNNLDHLVQQPTGCGEQNMVKFAPIISVSRYLLKTYQITPKLNELTQNYLKIGYQRQLTYRHGDGSFSAFGPMHTKEGGGTWLTAFVLRSFADCLKLGHVPIDVEDLKLSSKMLLKTQSNDGSFAQTGAPLFSKALAGGMSDKKAGLSAFVLVSLLKSFDALNITSNEDRRQLNKALEYLKNSVKDLKNADTYTLALVLYALKLGNYEKVLIKSIDNELNKRAVKENGLMYWKENKNEANNKNSWMENPSADLEITAYIMLSKLLNLEKNYLANIVPISKWINSKRNSLGGFHSTQDTVVALDALSEFARISYAKNINLKMAYYLNAEKNILFLNDLNRLLQRKIKLNKFKESSNNLLNFEIEGTGTALVQAIVKYNIHNNENKTNTVDDFEFSVFSSSSAGCTKSKLNIKAKYIGSKDSSSMAIVSIRLPSGWEPIQESIEKLVEKVGLKRFEIVENRISLYFDQLTKIEKNFDIEVLKKYEIKNTKPGLLTVYDYYEPMEEAVTQQFELSNDCN